jgi:hypothetical protein
MEGASTLELLAELAIGVLGFSGLVAALGRRASGEWSFRDRLRFFSMIFIGASVVALALIPFPLYHAGISAESLWGWSSGIGMLLILLFPVGMSRVVITGSLYRAIPVMWRDPEASNFVVVCLLLAIWGSPLLLLVNATGLLFERTFTPYLVAVLTNFTVTLVFFVRLLQTAVPSEKRAA